MVPPPQSTPKEGNRRHLKHSGSIWLPSGSNLATFRIPVAACWSISAPISFIWCTIWVLTKGVVHAVAGPQLCCAECVYIYIYIYIEREREKHKHKHIQIKNLLYLHTYICIYLYMYIYREREREEREIHIHVYIYIYMCIIYIYIYRSYSTYIRIYIYNINIYIYMFESVVYRKRKLSLHRPRVATVINASCFGDADLKRDSF